MSRLRPVPVRRCRALLSTITPVQTGQPLLRGLINIPEQIHQGDFVLRLTEGAQHVQATLDAVLSAPPDSELAERLISDALANAFVPLDGGLVPLSAQAKALWYAGLIQFLDELVLRLAGKIADPVFVVRETEEVAKFVESSDAHRAIPVVSFVARQRDLRE